MPEGDSHREAKTGAIGILSRFFRQIGRKVYVSSELNVYYPSESRFAPDVLAVCDVEPHQRMKWVVTDEGKGLDFVLEVHVAGDFAKDKNINVTRYARLGIPEYFLYDGARAMLWGYRLPDSKARSYQPILPQQGRYRSEMLGLELAVRQGRLRFFLEGAPMAEDQELVVELQSLVDELLKRREGELAELGQQLAEEQSQREAAERLFAEERLQREAEQQQREAAEQLLVEERQRAAERIAELEAELVRLRKG
jgi:Uma2 family endonuclease